MRQLALDAVEQTDREVEELQVEEFPPEEAYTKGTRPLPKFHAIAPTRAIFSFGSALSSSAAPQPIASLEAKAKVIVETNRGSPAMEEPALALSVRPTSVAALVSTLMSLQAKCFVATMQSISATPPGIARIRRLQGSSDVRR